MSALRRIESAEHRRQLLRLARATATRALGEPDCSLPAPPAVEGRFGGAFVTLWAGSTLRGCVGVFGSTTDICATIQEMTQAALADPRFVDTPVAAVELPNLEFEISILSDLEPAPDPPAPVPGVDGIVIRRGGKSGCFLPNVATERDWSAEEFLENCCTMKAGLPADAWREPDTEVLLFTADVFSESQFD